MNVEDDCVFDESVHEAILYSSQVKEGDFIFNTFVGPCKVVSKVVSKPPVSHTDWITVEYEGHPWIPGPNGGPGRPSEEIRTYSRSDPTGYNHMYEDEKPIPFFWRRKNEK